jgi:integrase
MALYRQRKSQFWWVSIYRGKGLPRIQVSTGTADRKRAESMEACLRAAHGQTLSRDALIRQIDELLGTKRGGLPLSDAWETYASAPEIRASAETMRKRRVDFQRFLSWMASHFPRAHYLHEVSREMALAFADEERRKGNRGKTWTNTRGNLGTMFQALMVRAALPENVWRVVPTGNHEDSESGRAFTPAEEARILSECRRFGREWYEVSLVARYTGLRYSDVVRLRWDQVEADRICLEPSKTRRHGIKVAIPLHQILADMLAALPRVSEWVFPDQHGRLRSSQRRGEFGKILDAAAVDGGGMLSFHCWRHTFRTRLAEAGVSKDLAQRLGGWTSDISELYNHDFEGLAKAIRSL